MNDSGTNSVKPPVRSWSSRTTRMCSASSHGSSMWPNITVTVERIPSACDASMISTHRATGSLFGRDPLPDAVVQDLGRRPRRRAEARPRAAARTPRRGERPRDVAHVRDLHRRVRVQVELRRGPLGHPQPLLVLLEAPVGMDPRLHADLGRAELDRLVHPPRELLLGVLVGVRRALALTEAAERAADDADVGDVDVAVDDERDRRRRTARRAAHRPRRASPRSPPGRRSANSAVSSSALSASPRAPSRHRPRRDVAAIVDARRGGPSHAAG